MNAGQTERQKLPVWPAIVFSTIACAVAVTGSLMRPVWHDELYTLWLARMPLTDLVSALRVDSGPPLHYLICHALYVFIGWPEGSGLGTFLVRLPSILAFAAMPWVLWRWARGHGERFFWAALLTMVWLPMLYFATEARAYALLALVNAVLWLLGPDLIKSGGVRIVLFSVVAAALPMLHYAGIVSFCFLPVLAFFIPRSRWRSFGLALGVASLPILAWSPTILGSPEQSMGWVDTAAGPGRPGLATVQVLAPAGPYPAIFEAPLAAPPSLVSISALLVMIVGCGAGVFRCRRQPGGEVSETRNIIGAAVGLLSVPVLALSAIAGVPVYFAGRSESMIWPLAASVLAAVLSCLPRAWRAVVIVPYVAIAAGTTAMWLVELPEIEEPPGVVVGRQLASAVRDNDVIVVAGLWQLEVEHGLAAGALEAHGGSKTSTPVRTIPNSQALHPGWLDLETVISRELLKEARLLERELKRNGARVWLVRSPALPLEQVFFPAFVGWRREPVVNSQVMAVELLMPSS